MSLQLCFVSVFAWHTAAGGQLLNICQSPTTVDIACRQLTYSSCHTHSKWNILCQTATREQVVASKNKSTTRKKVERETKASREETMKEKTKGKDSLPANSEIRAEGEKKRPEDMKLERKSKYLALLAVKTMYVLTLPTLKINYRRKRIKGFSDILFNEHDNRLYWLVRKTPKPSAGYFAGRTYKPVLTMDKGMIMNMGFDANALYFTHSNKTWMSSRFSLYSARKDESFRKLTFITMLHEINGHMIVSAKLSTVYVYNLKHKMLTEVNITARKTGRILKIREKYRSAPRIVFDNNGIIYLPFRSGAILALEIERWTLKKIHMNMPKGCSFMHVRHDQIVFAGTSRVILYNKNGNKWKPGNEKHLPAHIYVMGATLMA